MSFKGSGAKAARKMFDELEVENMDIPQAIEYARKIVLSGCLYDEESGGAIDGKI